MIYKIHFEPTGAYWCIQFQRSFISGWTSVTTVPGQGDVKKVILKFNTYDEAGNFVVTTGIDKAYDRRNTKCYASALQAGNLQPAPEGFKIVEGTQSERPSNDGLGALTNRMFRTQSATQKEA